MKPYVHPTQVTKEMLYSHPYFRTLDYSQLVDLLADIPYFVWETLEGGGSSKKAELLKQHYKNNPITTEKIIGYRCPMELFTKSNKPLPVGTILYPVITQGAKVGAFYADPYSATTSSYSRHIPAEIVETWEPAYKEEFKRGDYVTDDDGKNVYTYSHISEEKHYVRDKGYENISLGIKVRKASPEEIANYKKKEEIVLKNMGSTNITVKIQNGVITADGNVFSLAGLKGIRDTVIGQRGINNYIVSYPKVKIGCCEFEANHLNQIIQAAENQL